jgi:nucleotide-binding universal stress UspA family protein
MLAVRSILHPSDFSERSQYALGQACALARAYDARLVLLHVVAMPVVLYGEGALPANPEELRAAARAQLDDLQVPFANARTDRRLEAGDPVEMILRLAQEMHADLIVMGTHGRTGLGRLLMGSVAEQIVRKASCPVLTVKTPLSDVAPPSEIAAAAPSKGKE